MTLKERLLLPIINFSRKHFRNTKIHEFPITNKVYKFLFKILYRGQEKEIQFRGAKYIVPTEDISVVPSMISGEYEEYELSLFSKLIDSNTATILDIGANIGVYSIEASKRINKAGAIYAFEPVSENLNILKRNIEINNIKNVNIIPKAISNKKGVYKMYTVEDNIGTHSLGKVSDEYIEIDTTTIDMFVKENNLHLDLIKMDIEGYEGFAVEGARKTITKQKPIMFIEFDHRYLKKSGYSPKKHAEQLLELYRHCYHVDERKKTVSLVHSVDEISNYTNENLILSEERLDI